MMYRPSDSGSHVAFRIPLDIMDAALPEIGQFPYNPGESIWDGRAMFIKGSRSEYVLHS